MRITTLLILVLAAPIAGADPLEAFRGKPIVEIRDNATLENYICDACDPDLLDDLSLPPGFVASPSRITRADYGVVRKLPTDSDFVNLEIEGHDFQRIARVHGGATGLQPVTGGIIINLESDRTLRYDAGRSVRMIHDGRHSWVQFVSPDPNAAVDGLPLPDGWTRSTRTLVHDLVIFDPTGFPFIFQDAAQNLWQRLAVDPDAQLPSPLRVAGRKLKLVDVALAPQRRKLRWVARDAGIVPPSAGQDDDPTLAGAWLHVENRATGEYDSFALPASEWDGLGQPAGARGWRYRDPDQRNGPCKRVRLKPGRLVAVCSGKDIDLTLDEPSQGRLEIGLALGPTLDYCGSFGETAIRHDRGSAETGRGRFDATQAPAPAFCGLPPMVRRFLAYDSPADGILVLGRDADSPLLGFVGAMNMHTVQDPAADAAYSAAVFPLLFQTGAILLTANEGPVFVDTSSGPAEWAQPVMAMPHYPGADGLLGMVSNARFGAIEHLKEAQVGDSLHFGLQVCLHDCEFLTTGGLAPARIAGRVLAVHVKTSRFDFEQAVPELVDEADGTAGVRVGWAGRSMADVFGIQNGQRVADLLHPLQATGTILYVLEAGVDVAAVLALPELSGFLGATDAHVIAFFDPTP